MKIFENIDLTIYERYALIFLTALLITGVIILHVKRHYWRPDVNVPAGIIAEDRRVNVNEANFAELVLVPGIGFSTAEKIIRYRIEHGPFPETAALDGVDGIGPKKLEKILPFIKVE
jgi:competence ComEA-like helix-hairpin-helix protein